MIIVYKKQINPLTVKGQTKEKQAFWQHLASFFKKVNKEENRLHFFFQKGPTQLSESGLDDLAIKKWQRLSRYGSKVTFSAI